MAIAITVIAIAEVKGALVNKPALILADEPTGNLDPELSAEIMHLFEQFKQVGVTVLIATHDMGLVNQSYGPMPATTKGKAILSNTVLSNSNL
jgi:cell division transport system ATP-binding protein